jgi:hypothetical protein
LYNFGCDSFWTLIEGAASHKEDILLEIVDFARSKLLCHSNIHAKYTAHTPQAVTAILDVLLTLDFEPRREAAHKCEEDLVASNMRTAFSVPADRAYFRSGYPSEPLLAEAAARQMYEFQTLQPDINVMAQILQINFDSGLLDQGQRGEVVWRLLIMTAYMRAVRKDHDDTVPNFSKGCKLITLITELFTEEHANQILTSVPDNTNSNVTFADAFAEAVVRFTHFGRMADDTAATTNVALAAFIRCMAIICWSSHDIIDILLPVLLKRGEKLHERIMSSILVQIKRRKVKGSTAQYEINQASLGFFPSRENDDRPYVTIVAELGVQLPISPAAVTPARVIGRLLKAAPSSKPTQSRLRKPASSKAPSVTTTPSKLHIPTQPTRIHHPRDTHPRYSIFAYGCSDTVYKVISPTERSTYQLLLGSRDLLGEHPRQDPESLQAVRRMKPFWSLGPDCYDWIEDTFLRQDVRMQLTDEGVSVGQYEDDSGLFG